MVGAAELKRKMQDYTSLGNFTSKQTLSTTHDGQGGTFPTSTLGNQTGIPVLTLYNSNLNIRIVGVNGALIGRRQGPYAAFFENNMYVSGVHAQLTYTNGTGWSIIDKHSSNGSKLNNHDLQPDVPMSLKSGDIVSIANVNLQVSIS
ncbi:MAG: FHA domain-containing protein [Prevotella sp.]|nr:FHA domain-containing protein [Prevotella sp.]